MCGSGSWWQTVIAGLQTNAQKFIVAVILQEEWPADCLGY